MPDPFEQANWWHIPPDMRRIVRDYVEHGDVDDPFLHAVLANDLRASVHLATPSRRLWLVDIVRFLELFAPQQCWGSHVAIGNWMHRGGTVGGAALIAEFEHSIGKGRN